MYPREETKYHRLNQANVALNTGAHPEAVRADGANVVLTIYRQESGHNTSSMETFLTNDEAIALAHKLLRGALWSEAEDGSWWVPGVKAEMDAAKD